MQDIQPRLAAPCCNVSESTVLLDVNLAKPADTIAHTMSALRPYIMDSGERL